MFEMTVTELNGNGSPELRWSPAPTGLFWSIRVGHHAGAGQRRRPTTGQSLLSNISSFVTQQKGLLGKGEQLLRYIMTRRS